DYDRINEWRWQVRLTPPAEGAKSISLKGVADLQLIVSTATATIDEPEKHVSETIPTLGIPIHIVACEHLPTSLHVRLECAAGAAAQAAAAPQAQLPELPTGGRFAFLDSTGRVLIEHAFNTFADWNLSNPGPGPYKLKITVPTRTKQVSIPFDIKNLPLP